MKPWIFALATIPSIVCATTSAFEGNSAVFQNQHPDQYASYMASIQSSEEPDRIHTPYDPVQSINFGTLYNYRSIVQGKRSHANATLEAYWSSGGNTENFQRCLPCHSADFPGLVHEKGEKGYYAGGFDAVAMGPNPVGCANCHNTRTFRLRVSNPHAIANIKALGKDPRKLSKQELKTYVCTQCHFEYDKVEKDGVIVLESQWNRYGDLKALAKFYDERASVSFTHPLSKAPLVKPMNNEAGLATNGPHARHGVACADCHMPKDTNAQGKLYTNHDNVAASRDVTKSCVACHSDVDSKVLAQDVKDRMAEYNGENVQRLGREVASTHLLIAKGFSEKLTPEDFAEVYPLLRKAQWRWDYLLWQKGGAFHAAFETQKMLATALQQIAQAKSLVYEKLTKANITDLSVPKFDTIEDVAKILGVKEIPEGKDLDYSFVYPGLEKATKRGRINPRIYKHEKEVMHLAQ